MNSFMAGKKLDVTVIANELQGASAFFPSSHASPSPITSIEEISKESISPPASLSVESSVTGDKIEKSTDEVVPEKEQPRLEEREKASTQSREQESLLASTQASTLAKIRKAVRGVGREVSYVRLTQEEKRRILDAVYLFKTKDIKTTENEIMRIAANVLLEDYDLRKENSLLYKILYL